MLFSKTLLVLFAASFSLAAPAARQTEEGVTCTYHMTPSEEVPELDIDREVNYTIVLAVLESVPSGSIYNYGITPTLNDDGSYSNTGKIQANGLTAEEFEALVTGWAGKTLEGLPAFGIIWTVNDVACE